MLPQPEQREKSAIRNYAEKKAQQQGRKLTKKLAKKGAKVALKLIKAAAMKFVALLSKLLIWLAGTIGLPVIGIGLLIIVALIVISLSWSFLFGTGEGLEGDDKATHEYIIQQANGTVDMNSSLERPYRVPEKLIAATIQLEAFQKNDDIKEIIRKMANSLAPRFDYGKYNEWKEKQVLVYEDGKLVKEGKVQHTDNYVSKLDHVEYWNGSTTFKYTPKITPWKTTEKITYREEKYTETVQQSYTETVKENYTVYETNPVYKTTKVPYQERRLVKSVDENGRRILTWVTETKYREETVVEYVKVPVVQTRDKQITKVRDVEVEKTRKIKVRTVTKTRQQYFESSKSTTTDYATFDNVLNSYSLGIKDKQLIEANYLFLGGNIAYTDWLKTMGGGDLGFISFDGNIIPGSGVPPQFMPFYRSAEKKYGVHWYVLAAIHFVETGFSTHPTMMSSVGAVGHMQVRP